MRFLTKVSAVLLSVSLFFSMCVFAADGIEMMQQSVQGRQREDISVMSGDIEAETKKEDLAADSTELVLGEASDANSMKMEEEIPVGDKIQSEAEEMSTVGEAPLQKANEPEGNTVRLEAEEAEQFGGAGVYGTEVGNIVANGAGVRFAGVPAGNRITIRHASAFPGQMTLYIGETEVKVIDFPATNPNQWNTYEDLVINGVDIMQGADVMLRKDNDGLPPANLDYIEISKVSDEVQVGLTEMDGEFIMDMEAENFTIAGGAVIEEESAASDGKVVSFPSEGSELTIEGAARGNQLDIRYAAADAAGGKLVLEINEKEYDVEFPSTRDNTAYYMTAVRAQIPNGATIRLRYSEDGRPVRIDYMRSVRIEEGTVTAKDLFVSGNAVRVHDIGAVNAQAVRLDSSGTIRVLESAKGETLLLRYKSVAEGQVTVVQNGQTTDTVTLPDTGGGYRVEELAVQIAQSSALDISFSGEVVVDSITIAQSYAGQRKIINLNGFWDCEPSGEEERVPDAFNHQVMVPGLVDMAYPLLPWVTPDRSVPPAPDFQYVYYKKDVAISGDVPETALLKINKAAYGKKIWVNGQYVGEHQPNYTAGYFDIAPYLKGKGAVNTIVIRIGKRGTQPEGINAGEDIERRSYYPGIFDDVSLILTGSEYISYLKHAADIDNHTITVGVGLKNYTQAEIDSTVSLRVYDELTGQEIGAGNISASDLPVGEERYVTTTFDIRDYELWTVDSPKLYRLEATSGNDCFRTRIGIRTFNFDNPERIPMLNGEPYYLRGTHFAMYRFFEDSERLSLPWDKEWSREVIRMQKDLNFNSIRSHISFMPEHWIEICDEMGLLIQEEYPIWRPYAKYGDKLFDNKANAETTIPEIKDWIKERNNHPCIIVWDICNETDLEETGKIIDACRGEDLQDRAWDNGWAAPRSQKDMVEYHPYYEAFNQSWNTSQFENHRWEEINHIQVPNAAVVNEYGFIWINRDNTPGALATDYYHIQFPNATGAERRYAYGLTIAQQTEYFRTRRFAGVQYFAGLNYCRPAYQTGATSDNYLPGIYNLRYDPSFRKLINNSMAPVCLMVDYWQQTEVAGATVDVPVFVSNDSMEPWSGKVTVKLVNKNTGSVCGEESFDVAELGMGERTKGNVSLTFPETAGDYQMIAAYTDPAINDVPVESLRDVSTHPAALEQVTAVNAMADGAFVQNRFNYDLFAGNNGAIDFKAAGSGDSAVYIDGKKTNEKKVKDQSYVNVVGMKDAFADDSALLARYSFDNESYQGLADHEAGAQYYEAEDSVLVDCSEYPDAVTGETSVGDFYQKPNASLSFTAQNSGNTLDVSIVNASADAAADVYVNGELRTSVMLSSSSNCSVQVNAGDEVKLAHFTGWAYINRFCIRTVKSVYYQDESHYMRPAQGVKTSVNASGKIGNAMRTFGNGGYAMISPQDAAGLDGVNQLTVSAWVNIESNFIATAMVKDREVVLKGGNSGHAYRLMIGADKTVQFVLATDQVGWYEKGANVVTAPSTIHSGKWYHIAATYDGKEAAVYIDGKKAASAPLQGKLLSCNEPLYFGSSPEISSAEPGLIDEVAIYSRALTENEIAQMYESQNMADTYRYHITRKGGNIVENNSDKIYFDVSGDGQMWGMWETFLGEQDYSSQYKMSTTLGHYAIMDFEGDFIRYVARKTRNGGMAEVFIDGVSHGLVDLYGDDRQAVVFETELEQGAHTIKIVNSGKQNPASAGRYIGVDYLYYESSKEGLLDGITDPNQLGEILANNYESLGIPQADYTNLEQWGGVYNVLLPILLEGGLGVSEALKEAVTVDSMNSAAQDAELALLCEAQPDVCKITQRLTQLQKRTIADTIIASRPYARLSEAVERFMTPAGGYVVNNLTEENFTAFVSDTALWSVLNIEIGEAAQEYLNKNAAAKKEIAAKIIRKKPYANAQVFADLFIETVTSYQPPDGNQGRPDGSHGGGSGGGGGGSGGGGRQVVVPEPTIPPEPQGFLDIDAAFSWAREAIEYLNVKNIVNGVSEQEFDPGANVTRAQFVKMLIGAFALTDETASCRFDDVKESDWCYPYVAAAAKLGIVKGKSETSFGSEDSITREEMATMLARTMTVMGIAIDGEESAEFDDHSEIAEYAVEAVYAMKRCGIINGTPENRFEPKRPANRAEAAKIIYEAIK